MGLVLSFFILLILILGIIFLKVKISAKSLNLELFRKDLKKAEYDIRVSLYFLGFIKIGSIKIRNGIVELFFIKKTIDDLKKSNLYVKNIKPKFAQMSNKKKLNDLKKINFRLEDLRLNLELGTDSVVITSMLVGIISAIISSSMQIYIEKFNKEKYKWRVLPNFEENLFINLNASLNLSYSPILNKIVKHV